MRICEGCRRRAETCKVGEDKAQEEVVLLYNCFIGFSGFFRSWSKCAVFEFEAV